MKKWKKIALIVGGLLLVAIVVMVSINKANAGIVAVQIDKVKKQDLTSLVTASGEIRPKVLSNVLGEGFGKIVGLVGHALQRGESYVGAGGGKVDASNACAGVGPPQIDVDITIANPTSRKRLPPAAKSLPRTGRAKYRLRPCSRSGVCLIPRGRKLTCDCGGTSTNV